MDARRIHASFDTTSMHFGLTTRVAQGVQHGILHVRPLRFVGPNLNKKVLTLLVRNMTLTMANSSICSDPRTECVPPCHMNVFSSTNLKSRQSAGAILAQSMRAGKTMPDHFLGWTHKQYWGYLIILNVSDPVRSSSNPGNSSSVLVNVFCGLSLPCFPLLPHGSSHLCSLPRSSEERFNANSSRSRKSIGQNSPLNEHAC